MVAELPTIVPTLCVGTYVRRSAATFLAGCQTRRRASPLRSHAERGNDDREIVVHLFGGAMDSSLAPAGVGNDSLRTRLKSRACSTSSFTWAGFIVNVTTMCSPRSPAMR